MSRAFVKEPDGTEPIEVTERQISTDRNFVTKSGIQQIELEIQKLKQQLAPECNLDKMAKAQLLRDMRYWIARHESAELIEPKGDEEKVMFGKYIVLENANGQKILRIVGQDEADPTIGLISYTAPLAQALIGKQIGDEVSVANCEYEITAIKSALD